MPIWSDFFKLFTYAFEADPLSKKQQTQDLTGAGVSQPDAIPDIRQDGSYWGGGKGMVRLRDTNDFIDLSSVSNRNSRYKEYERLRSVAEIEMAMTVFADESCLYGETKIATLLDGLVPIKWLAQNRKDADFLVYCWDEKKKDYNLGWAFDPRLVKKAPTLRVILDDGSDFIATEDHRVLNRNGEWVFTGSLKSGDELMPFYRISPDQEMTGIKVNQFPRIKTFQDGWKHERQFVDEWRLGKKTQKFEKVNEACRLISSGLNARDTARIMGHQWETLHNWINQEGFSTKELKWLGTKRDSRRVLTVQKWKEVDVYDLSVREHKNFCGESCIFHNCQKGDNNHVLKIECANEEIKDEVEWLLLDRKMLNYDRRLWKDTKSLYIKGDKFYELVIDPDKPSDGVIKIQDLPCESIYRIETTKGKLVEFQQSKEGPDYESLTRAPVAQATESDLQQARAVRFSPNQIVHIKIGDDRETFYPYGQSLIEPARGPAHQLRLMEDAMVVYRLTRAPERRVFYIDVAQLPPFKAEAFMERLKDQFRKKKVATNKGPGASSVEERWHAPAADEDFWIPIRNNSNTRIETLPGAQNLGEIDDAVYFRNKLFTSLNFPKNYMSNEDAQTTRIALSAQDVKFARMIERLQMHIEDGIYEIATRHLMLRGYPEKAFEDLVIKLTPPSDWREMSRAEVITSRLNNAGTLKGSQMMSDFDILTKWMKYNEDEAKEMISRNTLQKLQDLKMQVLASNPQLLGIGVPGAGETEMGAEPGGPNPMLAPDQNGQNPPPDSGGEADVNSIGADKGQGPDQDIGSNTKAVPLQEPTEDDIKKYDLEIQSYGSEQDREEVDFSQEG